MDCPAAGSDRPQGSFVYAASRRARRSRHCLRRRDLRSLTKSCVRKSSVQRGMTLSRPCRRAGRAWRRVRRTRPPGPVQRQCRSVHAIAPVCVRSALLRSGAIAARNRADRVISSVVERFVHIEDVGGSNPSSPTIPPCPAPCPSSLAPLRPTGARLPGAPTRGRGANVRPERVGLPQDC